MLVAAAQDAPVFLDRRATTERVLSWIETAAAQGVSVLAFGETYLPGYPFWLCLTDAARFDDPAQKEAYRAYLEAAVSIDGPELREIAAMARRHKMFIVLGVAERVGGSVYATLVPIHPERGILEPHRKLRPTYEERLVWAPGDGHGLGAHDFGGLRLSALNCWENWMPLARYAAYAAGTELHIGIWPGSIRNTEQITQFVAREGRVFMLSASSVIQKRDIPAGFPLRETLPDIDTFHDGGSAVASPTGQWVVEPVAHERRLVIGEIDLAEVSRERQNFDPAGHYNRPDVFQVQVDRRRKTAAAFKDD